MSLSDASNIANIILGVIGLIGGIYAWKKMAAGKIKEKLQRVQKLYSGEWNNTKEIHSDNYKHYVSLELICINKNVTGKLNIRVGKDDETWANFLVKGRRRFSTIYLRDIFHNQKKYESVIKLSFKDGKLEWTLIKGDLALFPKNLELFRTLPTLI